MGVSKEGPGRPRWPYQRAEMVVHHVGCKEKQLGQQVVGTLQIRGEGITIEKAVKACALCLGKHREHPSSSAVLGEKPRHHRIIAIVGLQRGIPSKRESSARVDYVPPFVHTARRSYRLNGPVKCSDRAARRFAADDVARSPPNLII
ncbi:hypothetical protein Syun_006779 [Stephania yunnanensis]|uniref:Uncharacterized protein n=1 Tax=Stephania yunnanensis TaxID=152371 RepID=A0AAP0KX93_9MAGN